VANRHLATSPRRTVLAAVDGGCGGLAAITASRRGKLKDLCR